MKDQVELRQFIGARVIAELRSVSRAAEKLHVTQPALSTDMKKFQDALRVGLFLVASPHFLSLVLSFRPTIEQRCYPPLR